MSPYRNRLFCWMFSLLGSLLLFVSCAQGFSWSSTVGCTSTFPRLTNTNTLRRRIRKIPKTSVSRLKLSNNSDDDKAGGGDETKGISSTIQNIVQTTTQQVVPKLALVLSQALSQFTSGYMTGYFLGVVWGILRGNPTQRVLWGLEFACINAIYGASNLSAQLFWNAKDDSLWNVVTRNILLAFYFGRKSGWVEMLRNAIVYGGLTYYFVSQQQKRQRVVRSRNNNNNNNPFGTTSTTSGSVEDFLQQLNRMSSSTTPTPTPTTNTNKPSSNSKTPPPSSDVLDVEWERVDTAGDNEDGKDDDGTHI